MAWHPLTREEEQDLAVRWRKFRDAAARNQLIVAFDRAVQREARRYNVTTAKRDDLVQAGQLGVIRAAEKFEPDLGNRFLTYAKWWIKVYVHNEFYGKKNAVELLLILDSPIVGEDGMKRVAKSISSKIPQPILSPNWELRDMMTSGACFKPWKDLAKASGS